MSDRCPQPVTENTLSGHFLKMFPLAFLLKCQKMINVTVALMAIINSCMERLQ